MLHETENREDLELHLKANKEKFSKQCVVLMEDMYKGKRLNAMIVEREYQFNSRRLRDCRQGRPDIVKSVWIVDKENNTKYVEYWIERPLSPTKAKAVAEGQKILDLMNSGGFNQIKLF